MPFAIIAVTLLVLGTAYGVICADIEKAGKGAEGMENEIVSLDDAKDSFVRNVESSLGSIIAELSRAEAGTVGDRCKKFSERAKEFFDTEYPKTDFGVTATVSDHRVEIVLQKMTVASASPDTAAVPSYLRAFGWADVTFKSVGVVSSHRIELSADGSSGLPLLVEGASKFELCAGNGSSMLEQLISYQLTALAQKRIMDGYGSQHSGIGASSILTKSDVSQAFRNSVSVLEAMCFKSPGGNVKGLEDAKTVDAADLLITKNGYVTVDLSAIFAQTLIGLMDAIVGHWLSYLCFDKVVQLVDDIINCINNAVEATVDFVKGYLSKILPIGGSNENEFDMAAFISSAMAESGIPESVYRHPFRGKNHVVNVPARTLASGDLSWNMPALSVKIPYKDVDPTAWGGWKSVCTDVGNENVGIRATLCGIIESVANEIAKGKTVGKVTFKANPYDSKSFTDAFLNTVSKAFNANGPALKKAIHRGIDNGRIPDPLYAAVCQKLNSDTNSVFGISAYDDGYVREHLRSAVRTHLERNNYVDPDAADSIVSSLPIGTESRKMRESASDIAEDCIRAYENVSVQVARKSGSCFKAVVGAVVSKGMDSFNVTPFVKKASYAICNEAFQHLGANPYSEPVTLPGSGPYVLKDKNGNTYREDVSLEDSIWERIRVSPPSQTGKKNVHFVGFERTGLAGYTNVFTVEIDSKISYRASSGTEILSVLGTSDATLSGEVPVSMKIDIPVVSGWPLAGVRYESTANIFSDAMKALLKVLEPLMEPLRQMYKSVEMVMNACATALMHAAEFMQELIVKMYDAISIPLKIVEDIIQKGLNALGNIVLSKIGLSLKNQKIAFSFFDHVLILETDAYSLTKNTKSIVKITLEKHSGNSVRSATMDLKKKGDDFVFSAGGKARGNGWNFDLDIDPFMRSRGEIVKVSGELHGVSFSAVAPKLVQYQKLEVRMSQMPGVGRLLSNIPVPVPGYKGSLDFGASLKYNLPTKAGLVINEFESNPSGNDRGNEWVEILNNTGSPVNLEGYVLEPQSDKNKRMVLGSQNVAPGGKTVVRFDKLALNNASGPAGKGESLKLISPTGAVCDKTPWFEDEQNDGRTWQRCFDGSLEWTFANGSEAMPNKNVTVARGIVETVVKNAVKNAFMDTFGKMGENINSLPELSELVENTIVKATKEIIAAFAGMLVDASIFVQFELTDLAETQHYGIRLALSIGKDFLETGLKWISSQILGLAGYLSDPSALGGDVDIVRKLAECVFLRTTVYAGVSAPRFLKGDDLGQIMVGVTVGLNVPAIAGIFGKDLGQKVVEIGLVAEDVPTAALPPSMGADPNLKSDLYLLKATFRWS